MVVRWGDTNISQLLILRPCWLQLWHFCSRPLILDVMDNVSNPTCSADVKMTKKRQIVERPMDSSTWRLPFIIAVKRFYSFIITYSSQGLSLYPAEGIRKAMGFDVFPMIFQLRTPSVSAEVHGEKSRAEDKAEEVGSIAKAQFETSEGMDIFWYSTWWFIPRIVSGL